MVPDPGCITRDRWPNSTNSPGVRGNSADLHEYLPRLFAMYLVAMYSRDSEVKKRSGPNKECDRYGEATGNQRPSADHQGSI